MRALGYRLTFLGILLCAFWVWTGTARTVCAAAPEILPGCDPQYMDALEAKAWMNAQRRTAQNKNFILKPDSVLEYSCFTQFIGYLAANPEGRRFSENYPVYPLWGPISVTHELALDLALFRVVTVPAINYLTDNFFHTFLAGRIPDPAGPAPAYGEYDCDAMQYVWLRARCSNLIEAEIDDFYDFVWYTRNDPRQIPEEFSCHPPEMGDEFARAIIETYRGRGQDGAHGDEFPAFILAPDDNNPYIGEGPYDEDPILAVDLNDLTLPGPCAISAEIPTGIEIVIPGQGSWDEHVCTIAGCSYDGAECVR